MAEERSPGTFWANGPPTSLMRPSPVQGSTEQFKPLFGMNRLPYRREDAACQVDRLDRSTSSRRSFRTFRSEDDEARQNPGRDRTTGRRIRALRSPRQLNWFRGPPSPCRCHTQRGRPFALSRLAAELILVEVVAELQRNAAGHTGPGRKRGQIGGVGQPPDRAAPPPSLRSTAWAARSVAVTQ
jgi:hypothetical protein